MKRKLYEYEKTILRLLAGVVGQLVFGALIALFRNEVLELQYTISTINEFTFSQVQAQTLSQQLSILHTIWLVLGIAFLVAALLAVKPILRMNRWNMEWFRNLIAVTIIITECIAAANGASIIKLRTEFSLMVQTLNELCSKLL